jgi:uncharacterized protein YukE
MSGNKEIKLDPEVAENTVSSIKNASSTLAGYSKDIKSCKTSVQSWKGEAGSAVQDACDKLLTSLIAVVAGVETYSSGLNKASAALQSTDEKIANTLRK